MTPRCLRCYGSLTDDEIDFHPACSRSFFGQTIPPVLPYGLDTLSELAAQIVRQRIAVTGVQPKLSLDLERQGTASRLTLVGLWGQYILKPPFGDFPTMPENEDLTMHLATLFGIKTVPHTLIRLQTGELAYLTKRIDRLPDGRKVAMEDFCQLAERQTADKYKGSMEQVAKLILRYSSQAPFDLGALYELTLFCFLTGNADMHLKNFSLWRTNGQISLTPAYDLVATKLLLPEDNEELALTLNGRKNRIKPQDWLHFAQTLGLTTKQQANIHKRFQSRLEQAMALIDSSFLPKKACLSYIELMQERQARINLNE
jgi:serine/threonine-protein kinase HipA